VHAAHGVAGVDIASDGDAPDRPLRGSRSGGGLLRSRRSRPHGRAVWLKVNRRGSAGGFHRDRQSKAVTANSGRVASGHGVVASGHGVAKYAMLPPLHRCPVDVCSRHEHQNSVSDSPLTSLARGGFHGGSRLDATVTVPRTRLRSTVPRRIRSQAPAPRATVPVRSSVARSSFTLGAHSRSELVHARSSFRNKRHVPLGKKSPPSPNALIARPGGSNASAMDRPWPPGPSRTPRCAARNMNHAPSLPPGPRRPATPLRSGPVPPPLRTP